MNAPRIITFGCRLNSYESEIIRAQPQFRDLGNTAVFNTCAVTAEAQRQARQAIRSARRKSPDTRIVVTGCAAQTDPQMFADMPEVDLVLGNEEKLEGSNFVAGDGVRVGDIMTAKHARAHRVDGLAGRTRGFVQVQNGCDHRCTFCIIPYGRGNSRSLPVAEVVAQVERLVETGHAEIVLTGVDITSYGADLENTPTLGELVRQILRQVPALKRLRLSSVDSIEVDETLMRLFAEEERLMPHLHLSLQSGDDMILKRMKRRHARKDAVATCQRLRSLRPEITFGADLIAGFPTETPKMFANTLQLVDDCGLTWLHVFPYSARPGTPAARMPQLDGRIVRERAESLRLSGERQVEAHLDSESGKTRSVLAETEHRGRTPQNAPVRLATPVAAGEVVDVVITGHSGSELEGRLAP